MPRVTHTDSLVLTRRRGDIGTRTEIWKVGSLEIPPTLPAPALASPHPSLAQSTIPIVEEIWQHALDQKGYMEPSLDFNVMDGAVTKNGRTCYSTVGMAVVEQGGWHGAFVQVPDGR